MREVAVTLRCASLPLWVPQVGMETEGFAIYDTMMQVKNEVGPLPPSGQLLVRVTENWGRLRSGAQQPFLHC